MMLSLQQSIGINEWLLQSQFLLKPDNEIWVSTRSQKWNLTTTPKAVAM